jgi:hypothetical protein
MTRSSYAVYEYVFLYYFCVTDAKLEKQTSSIDF